MAYQYSTLDDLDVTGKRVLVRADLNVPVRDGRITDTARIDRQAPTIRELAERGARVIVLSHFGRPKGRLVPELSLKPIAPALSRAIGRTVAFGNDCIGDVAKAAVSKLKDGDVLLLENTRFHAGEEANDPDFARALAELGDLYVNDAFSAAHRAHGSTEGVAHILPSAAGRAIQDELLHLHRALDQPNRPVLAIIGGAKVSTKIALIENLLKKVDILVIGGAMANTFLAAEDIDVGKSLYEADQLDTAKRIVSLATETGTIPILPSDVVVAKVFEAGAPHRTVPAREVAADDMILDVGPDTIADFEQHLQTVNTLVWNGPVGAFETPPFDHGTMTIARLVAARTKAGHLLSVAGGGDTVSALKHAGVAGDFSYVSTAGGAFLEWLEGRELPGVAALAASVGVAQ
ncbi:MULTISPECIES: phosphoglycerate kinase [Novosphingobium]|uniref:Phosphoglycerate kinase n=1 Tax=Novosphingobium mangrovi (ex Huang et al. 2023) TaxID=2976432 RepID=A0ABT2IB47_9SPHN|nr:MULTISPECIES: phosphoglycerate kinase [Novosphingobium]MCT2402018.1 phosphoglycerate kinase [Novosphingobium mangrovi (ex Huang et al. 2023)]CCA93123.1 phosphoglycerate kinase [Novosphingobium sp. PP1Y]